MDKFLDTIRPYYPQLLIASIVISVLSLVVTCAKDPVILPAATSSEVEGLRAEVQVLQAEIEDYRRIRREDNVIREETQTEINEHFIDIETRLSRKPQSLVRGDNWDVNIDGPVDGKYTVTLDYFGYTYQKVVDGDPNTPENTAILFRWETQKMEEVDAAISHNKSAAQVP